MFRPDTDKDYICPQCGADSNGPDVHALTHHSWPFMTVNEAIATLTDETEDSDLWEDYEDYEEYTDEDGADEF